MLLYNSLYNSLFQPCFYMVSLYVAMLIRNIYNINKTQSCKKEGNKANNNDAMCPLYKPCSAIYDAYRHILHTFYYFSDIMYIIQHTIH